MSTRPKPKVTTYRDFMASRGYIDSSKHIVPSKPVLLPFEFNEEEEREINEAIAREEEWMRIEEEGKNGMERMTYSDLIKPQPYVSFLYPSANDTNDEKQIKQLLDGMMSQVCRWDKQYGWLKNHIKKSRQKTDSEKIQMFSMKKYRMNQRELLIAEHVEKLKKEINKRRTKMENEAEKQCGLLTPWRKSRTRPQRSSKPKANAETGNAAVKKEVINPADITLGGDTYDYSRDAEKKFNDDSDSIATNVARRRRTSNLSKSDNDDDMIPRASKERRLSESDESTTPTTTNKKGGQPAIDRNVRHCVCQTMYDETKFYVMCDLCSGWFHAGCVGLDERKITKMNGWTCEQCFDEQERVKNEPQLFCVCKKPYDDTKFYVGCDACQGWFHPECVGTTRAAAENSAEYICPVCLAQEAEKQAGYESSSSEASVASRSSAASITLTRSDYTYVMELLELLLEHRMSTPFRNPVSLDDCPDYNQVIKYPIDLSIIANRVETIEYRRLSHFVNDVNQMFENAKKYNPPDHAIFKCAETMQEVFEKRLLEVKDIIKQHHEQHEQTRRRLNSEGQHTLDGSLDIETDQLLPLHPSILGLFNF